MMGTKLLSIYKIFIILILHLYFSHKLSATEFNYPKPPENSPVKYDKYSFLINGERIFIASGEFHYWRLPSPTMWEPVLRRMKANGLNAVSIYFNWSYHSPANGVYDFTGIRDVKQVLEAAQKAGLYVIARPGPYINAETDAGGLPAWLLTSKALLRSADPAYLAAVEQWFDEIVPIMADYQLHKGGPVILFQIENELGDGDPAYMQALYRMTRERGIIVPIFHNDSIAWIQYPNSVDISGHDDYPAWFFCREPWTMDFLAQITDEHEEMYRQKFNQQHIPMFEVEYQGGSIDFWGGPGYECCYQKLGPEFVNVSIKSLLGEGTTAINQYMFYGGTTWGYLGYPGVYTSYDYGSPLREWTNLGPRYDASKRLMFFCTATQKILTKTDRCNEIVEASNPALLFRARKNPDSETVFIFLRNMDEKKAQHTRLNVKLNAEIYKIPEDAKTIHLLPRGMKILCVNYPLHSGKLLYSTSEILTIEQQGKLETVVLWGNPGESGETRLKLNENKINAEYSKSMEVRQRDGDFLIKYKYTAQPQYFTIKKDVNPLLMVIVDEATASAFWRVPTEKGNLLVQGGYFVDSPDHHGIIRIETSQPTRFQIYGDELPEKIHLNSSPIPVQKDKKFQYGQFSITNQLKLPQLPILESWSYKSEPFEGMPDYDDSQWSPVTERRSLSPDEHGFHHGFIWYRGKFAATGEEKALNIQGYHSYTVWINGEFLGSSDESSLQTFNLPPKLLKIGKENTIAVLIESLGHDQGGEPSKRPIGITEIFFSSNGRELRSARYHVSNMDIFHFDENWGLREKELFYGGGGFQAEKPGAKVKFNFEGANLKIFGATGPDHGQASVIIDGHKAGEIDAYIKWIPGQRPLLFEINGWDSGTHTAEIVLAGQKNPNGTGTKITIDAIEASSWQPNILPVKINWCLQGTAGGEPPKDPIRGHFNASGLYGERHGWYEPDFDDTQWPTVTIPHHFDSKNTWIGWYRTRFQLNLPENLNLPLGLQMEGQPENGAKYLIFLNGYLLGRYWPDKGPQTHFYLHPGILNERGQNSLAIAVWRRSVSPGRLGKIYLKPWAGSNISIIETDKF